ncbi:MAG: hypothetical protein IBX50_04110 [Marinospirillum sp.]|uniref:hypothetical protein n=1 Tax=Marinospirillum sp. TaxID=2183934 RepID=UPI001A04C796|nr:hypothetical protein [Marinospirillum sp.]MBE0505890.1 hypothetical protein [Marinospirillum sp.]
MKKQKRKPSAMNRLIEKRTLELAQGLVFLAVGDGSPVVPLFKNVIPPQRLADAAVTVALKRRMPKTAFLTKICRSESGQEYIAEPVEISLSSCRPDDLIDPDDADAGTVADMLADALSGITHNKSHYICDAYLIANRDREFTEQWAVDRFTENGAWRGKAKWESKDEQ